MLIRDRKRSPTNVVGSSGLIETDRTRSVS
jgi:hypothetical protein